MGKQRSLRSKAIHLVSGLTTVLLNPISDKLSNKSSSGDEAEAQRNLESISEEAEDSVNEPDTSSFTAFLYSLLKDDYFAVESEDGQQSKSAAVADEHEHEAEAEPLAEHENVNVVRESGAKRGLFSRGKQSLGRAMNYATRLALFRSQASERKPSSPTSNDDDNYSKDDGADMKPVESNNEALLMVDLPDMTESSALLSMKTRIKLYASLPALVRGKKWVLLYRCWFIVSLHLDWCTVTCVAMVSLSLAVHGGMAFHSQPFTEKAISTLALVCWYHLLLPICESLVSMFQAVGDRAGAVFGGVVVCPLNPCKSRRYQGSNSTFLFSDAHGEPVIYRPTGANRYYTLCSPDFLALGGGLHFALYLDNDLLNGSSAASETYGNPCLALSQDFEVKEVELWGFALTSQYEQMLAVSQNEAPGICRWSVVRSQ
ncbi:hypothetical protein Cgig2_008088 [Carnegiea gigantea]|uniref:Oxidation resistance protein 1 n=1 Tax=Carnegiea gigantea TaxID=171969 RepID=A0A9Q1L2B7_9CARY|nr:hypothetical protein Cgig2_008088 [Carnegiea gigantea]